jgi:hypothetical protein
MSAFIFLSPDPDRHRDNSMHEIKNLPPARYFQTCGGGKVGMAEYRAYTVGGDGHFIGFEPLVCRNDAEAIERARRLIDGHAIELWSGARFVARLEPEIKRP